MSWEIYPSNYRLVEVQAILSAARAGDCVSVIGLSGAGKSNLLSFIHNRTSDPRLHVLLADCNRLPGRTPAALFRLLCRTLNDFNEAAEPLEALDLAFGRWLATRAGVLVVLLDRFEALLESPDPALFNNLRALRSGLPAFSTSRIISTLEASDCRSVADCRGHSGRPRSSVFRLRSVLPSRIIAPPFYHGMRHFGGSNE